MAAHPVDIHVGKKLRMRRSMLGLSQDNLGKQIGVTFQQIQKYERGVNRIGSSRLYEFANVLEVPVSYFFEDFERGAELVAGFAENNDGYQVEQPEYKAIPIEPMDSKETLSLVRAYYRIKDPGIRRKVLGLVRAMGPGEESEVQKEA